MIVLWPHARLWRVAPHAPWLTHVVVAMTYFAAATTVACVAAAWFRPRGVRCLAAIALGAVGVLVTGKVCAHVAFVPRPFVEYGFTPLYPHDADSSFPSTLTAYFAVTVIPVLRTWRAVGWILVGVTVEVALACVYVGVHFGSDVLAGAALGLALGLVSWWLLGWRWLRVPLSAIERWLEALHARPRQRTAVR
jgi:membrane-associated phospholipid phosphatase